MVKSLGRSIPFYFVDVFAVEPLTGNPLVVVDGCDDLPLDLFQRIAREFNQSETTFIQSPTHTGRPPVSGRLRWLAWRCLVPGTMRWGRGGG
jgi:trans-2,3-dihydro-3-hydroxyanthranilate isomerase